MHLTPRSARHLTILTAMVGTLAATSACAGLAGGQLTLKVRQTAPEIALTDQHNQPVSLHALTAGSNVLVVFYRGHF